MTTEKRQEPSIFLFANGNVAVTGEDGQQVGEWQGTVEQVLVRALTALGAVPNEGVLHSYRIGTKTLQQLRDGDLETSRAYRDAARAALASPKLLEACRYAVVSLEIARMPVKGPNVATTEDILALTQHALEDAIAKAEGE